MKWNADLYDDKHSFVFQYGESVMALLDAKPGERVLDVGCGTAHLTNQLREQGIIAKGVDASPEMIAKAKELFPELDVAVANATDLGFNQEFDAVFSNATLHWVKDADAAIKSIWQALKPGGRFVAEMGGKGNIQHLIEETSTVLSAHGYAFSADSIPWYFPSTAEYATKLEAQGFRVTFMAHFDRKTLLQDGRQGVPKWLKMFGASFFKGIPEQQLETILDEIAGRLEPYYANADGWYADYVRLRFIAVK